MATEVVVVIRANGTVETVDDVDIFTSPTRRRASNIEPVNAVLRWCFHTLRWCFGEVGIVSEFTRRWSVTWRVNMLPSSGPCFGTYALRSDALAAERRWLADHRGF